MRQRSCLTCSTLNKCFYFLFEESSRKLKKINNSSLLNTACFSCFLKLFWLTLNCILIYLIYFMKNVLSTSCFRFCANIFSRYNMNPHFLPFFGMGLPQMLVLTIMTCHSSLCTTFG